MAFFGDSSSQDQEMIRFFWGVICPATNDSTSSVGFPPPEAHFVLPMGSIG